MISDSQNNILEYLYDLRGLKENTAFRRYMKQMGESVEHLKNTLVSVEPIDQILISRIQAKITDREAMISEYNGCEEMIINIESQATRGKTKQKGGGNTPPKE